MKLLRFNKNRNKSLPQTINNNFADISLFSESFLRFPSINISEDKKKYKIEVAVPGFDKKDIKVETENNFLIISSEKKAENKKSGKNLLKQEYSYSSFRRVIRIPENADENKIKAKMKNGVLKISISKKEGIEMPERKIEVK